MRFIGIVLGFLCLLVALTYFSTSYELGRDAQKEFNTGNFESAYTLATEALEEDPYNRSAFAIANHSKQRIAIQKFLQDAKERQKEAFETLKSGRLTPEQFLRLSWIVEEFQKGYQELLFTNLPNTQESEELKQYQQWFSTLKTRLDSIKK